MAEEIIDEVVEALPKFPTIGNLENGKRAFFNGDFEIFQKEVMSKPYRFFTCYYKYSSDYTGKPDFIARNLNNGFIKQLEDYRKYLMCVFRCTKVLNTMFSYTSLWIVNTTEDINKVIGSISEDFDWEEIKDESHKKSFLDEFRKQEENDQEIISECYLH